MAKTAERNLSSEERCRKAFEERWGPRPVDEPSYQAWVYHLEGWGSAWRYLESRVEEYVKS